MKKNQKIGIKMFGKRINWEKDRKLLTEEEEEGFGWRDSLRVGSRASWPATFQPSFHLAERERKRERFLSSKYCEVAMPHLRAAG